MIASDDQRADLDSAGQMLVVSNWPQAEMFLRRYLFSGGRDPVAHHLLAVVAQGYGFGPAFRLSEKQVKTSESSPKYLLIKAWGYGFWSDVHHVLGQLLLAELTQRTPIVHWGGNSLFGDSAAVNAFELYFDPVSAVTLSDLSADLTVYPPKWTHSNLSSDDVNKWDGLHSRMPAQSLFHRKEDVLVSDFYTTVNTLLPWVAADSAYHGLTDDAVYLALFAKYLKPHALLCERVAAFWQANMAGRHWVAAHVRGSDKIYESAGLHQTNQRYCAFIDRIIELNPGIGVFLLTDSVEVHADFQVRYGDRLRTTPALRSDSSTGVHMQGHSGRTVGEEVLIDALLAVQCDYFIGNKESNVSLAIASMKPWSAGLCIMLGDKSCRADNFFLHNRKNEPVDVLACRLCRAPVQRLFDKLVLGRHTVSYHRCMGCGALQTDSPTWLDEAYAGSAELYDTGKASRTLVNFLALPPLLAILGVRKTDMAVDFGGGTGLLARLMRYVSYNFHSFDKFGSSEFMGGYVWEGIDHPCRLVTLFEVAEHFANPAEEWQRLFVCDPDWVIGSTSLFNGQGADWPYLSCESGQHVFFYSTDALNYVAHKAGRFAYNLGMYFLITRTPLEEITLAAIKNWAEQLYPACQASFESWARGPYRHASADNAEVTAYARLRQSGKKIAIDGTFFRYATGISRVWKSLLAQWSASGLAPSLVVIDRGRTAPRLPGIRYVEAPLYDYANAEQDRAMLQGLCDQESVGLFISTYYTIPLTTPSALMLLDMIPEVMGFDLSNLQWVAKRQAIEYAQAFVSISHSTERDLARFYPHVQTPVKAVAHCGCDFRPAAASSVSDFKARHGISKPYFLISGGRSDYKNATLFFQAFAHFAERRGDYAVVCTNANQPLESEFAAHVGTADIHMLVLSDTDLQCAYSGALALAYPSRYEGFGLPVAEAMACACPVITCRNSSLIEVGGDAVVYVDPDNVDAMYQALLTVLITDTRADLIARGLKQAESFSWAKMACEVGQHLATWAGTPYLALR